VHSLRDIETATVLIYTAPSLAVSCFDASTPVDVTVSCISVPGVAEILKSEKVQMPWEDTALLLPDTKTLTVSTGTSSHWLVSSLETKTPLWSTCPIRITVLISWPLAI